MKIAVVIVAILGLLMLLGGAFCIGLPAFAYLHTFWTTLMVTGAIGLAVDLICLLPMSFMD